MSRQKNIKIAVFKFIKAIEKIDNFEDLEKMLYSYKNIAKAIGTSVKKEDDLLFVYSIISNLSNLLKAKNLEIRNNIIKRIL